ncbi:MAG: hypothetical protein CM1200mP2_13080 [Planctomycetaceae bacterium]|nr:MAG: hypothetical protein CM1200mP2_13080 [Planctomycetaceae bacterium]
MTYTAKKTVRVGLEQGLHMVPCSLIVGTAERFSCEIQIQKEDRSADAKTMLDLLTLSAENGSVLVSNPVERKPERPSRRSQDSSSPTSTTRPPAGNPGPPGRIASSREGRCRMQIKRGVAVSPRGRHR